MKCYYILTLFFYLISLAAAAPVAGGSGTPPVDKGKGRAIDPPIQPSGRPNTPTPETDPSVPLPGRHGVHHDPNTNVVTAYYGDDNLPEHMGHLQRNQAAFPHNRNPMSLAGTSDRNRYNALRNVPPATKQPGSGVSRVKDEKLPALLNNPNHATSTTVEYLPKPESNKEGSFMSDFKKKIEEIDKAGQNAQGQLRPNPGWLPLHPDQQRGHEAPARLNSQTKVPPKPNAEDMQKKKKKKGPSTSKTPANTKAHGGYTPTVGQMALRHRKGQAPPPPPPPKEKRPTKGGPSALRPGAVAPAGHIWKPSDGSKTPSHVGAPGHLAGADQRHPPRPQDHDHYMKQLQAKKDGEAKQQKAKSSSPEPKAKPDQKGKDKHSTNLAKFNADFGHARPGNGAGTAHEAPGRMQTRPSPSSSSSKPASSKSSHSDLKSAHKPASKKP